VAAAAAQRDQPAAPTTGAEAEHGSSGAGSTPAEFAAQGEQFKQLAHMAASSLSASATDPEARTKLLAAAQVAAGHAKRVLDAFLAGYVGGKNDELRAFLAAERAKLLRGAAGAGGGAGGAAAAAPGAVVGHHLDAAGTAAADLPRRHGV